MNIQSDFSFLFFAKILTELIYKVPIQAIYIPQTIFGFYVQPTT